MFGIPEWPLRATKKNKELRWRGRGKWQSTEWQRCELQLKFNLDARFATSSAQPPSSRHDPIVILCYYQVCTTWLRMLLVRWYEICHVLDYIWYNITTIAVLKVFCFAVCQQRLILALYPLRGIQTYKLHWKMCILTVLMCNSWLHLFLQDDHVILIIIRLYCIFRMVIPL